MCESIHMRDTDGFCREVEMFRTMSGRPEIHKHLESNTQMFFEQKIPTINQGVVGLERYPEAAAKKQVLQSAHCLRVGHGSSATQACPGYQERKVLVTLSKSVHQKVHEWKHLMLVHEHKPYQRMNAIDRPAECRELDRMLLTHMFCHSAGRLPPPCLPGGATCCPRHSPPAEYS